MWFRNCLSLTQKRSMANTKGLSNEAQLKFGKKHLRNSLCAILLLTLPQTATFNGIICEEGIIAPQSVTEVMRRAYPWVFKNHLELSTVANAALSSLCVLAYSSSVSFLSVASTACRIAFAPATVPSG